MFDKINQQKNVFERGIIIGMATTFLAFVLFMPVVMMLGPVGFFLIVIPFMGGGIYSNKNVKKIKELSNDFKQIYVRNELEKVFPNSKYFFDKGFTEQEVINSKLLRNQDRFSSEDMVTGMFENVSFRCSDVHQKDVRKSGKNKKVVTVFQGRLYEFDFFKNFKYNLLLLQPILFGPFLNYKRVKLESVHFNSELMVFAKDEHEAFYILTPHFMERLLVLDRKYKDKISFSFIDNKLYIAVDNRVDNFDFRPFKPVDSNLIESYLDEFKDMKEFITLLTLTSRLFK